MEKIYKKARAKINLTLNVLEKRKDGYHNLESVFQIINIYDELFIEKNNKNTIKLFCDVEELNNNNNIIYKAYNVLKSKYNKISGVNVKLIKNIPSEAGLGGGSADCAQFILGMNKLFDLELSQEELIDISKKLGADVVPCLYNQCVFGEGIGEIITKVNTNIKYYLVIIKPKISCNTTECFVKLDNTSDIVQKYNSYKMIKVLEQNNIDKISKLLYNVFEEVILNQEELTKIKKELIKNGAIGALMSGSGSSIYGIFNNKDIAKNAYKKMKEVYEDIFITINKNSKKEI